MRELERDDVDHEFKKYKFGVRKSVFKFLKGTVESLSNETSEEESV